MFSFWIRGFWVCVFRGEAAMISGLCVDTPMNTLQTVCSAAPLPSAECQASTPLSDILHFVLHQHIQQLFQKASQSRCVFFCFFFTESTVKYTCFNQGSVGKHAHTLEHSDFKGGIMRNLAEDQIFLIYRLTFSLMLTELCL